MELKKIIVPMITILVCVLVVGAVLPVFADTSASEDTFTNKGYFYVDEVVEDQSITYKFEDHKFYINGEETALPTGSQYPDGLTILYTEHICIRYDGGYMKVRGVANHNAYYLNITVTNGTITGNYEWTVDNPNATVNWTYTEFVGMYPTETDRIMCKSEPQYLKTDSVIDTTGLVNLTNITGYYVVHITGTISDGITVKFYNQGNGAEINTITAEDITINKTEVSTHEDLYKVNSITFVANDGSHTDNVTFTIYTIPAEVTADRVVSMDPAMSTLFNMIPLIIVAGLVLSAVGLYLYRRI